MDKSSNEYGRLIDRSLNAFRTSFEPGERISGVITGVTSKFVYVDVNAKSEGIIARQELETAAVSIGEGETIEAFYAGMGDGGEINLTVSLNTRNVQDDTLRDAWTAGIPVEGKVAAERKGGFGVKLGSRDAFCPYSQIDTFVSPDKTVYVGQRLTFLITEYDDFNIVVSRRQHLAAETEKQLDHLKESLKEGDIVEGTVRKIMDFGVFVDIGGVEGLIPMGELAWSHVKHAGEIVSVGEHISVMVQKLQWDAKRITFSLRKIGGDPWGRVGDNYHETKQYHGRVTKLMDFGAFVELEPGVEGLIHISKLGAGKRLDHSSQVLEEGQALNVYIESIDRERRRIGLVLENPQQGRTMDVEGEKLTVGESMMGTVDDIKNFGVFVRLTPSHSGLLHISEIQFDGQVNRMKAMYKQFPPGSEVNVIIKSIKANRVSLTLPDNRSEDEDYQQFMEETETKNFGSLESAFGGLEL